MPWISLWFIFICLAQGCFHLLTGQAEDMLRSKGGCRKEIKGVLTGEAEKRVITKKKGVKKAEDGERNQSHNPSLAPQKRTACVMIQSKMRPALIMPLSSIKMEHCITHNIPWSKRENVGRCTARTRTKAVVESILQELIVILAVLAEGRREEQQHH